MATATATATANAEVNDNGNGNGNGGVEHVVICHVPPGNPDNEHTITVGEPAVDAHVENHDDTMGPCDADTTTTSTTSTIDDVDGGADDHDLLNHEHHHIDHDVDDHHVDEYDHEHAADRANCLRHTNDRWSRDDDDDVRTGCRQRDVPVHVRRRWSRPRSVRHLLRGRADPHDPGLMPAATPCR